MNEYEQCFVHAEKGKKTVEKDQKDVDDVGQKLSNNTNPNGKTSNSEKTAALAVLSLADSTTTSDYTPGSAENSGDEVVHC